MLHSGKCLPVEQIQVGDVLMGPDSLPRIVTSLATGTEMMYRITPTKGESFTVNESHILSLKITGLNYYLNAPNGQKCTGGDIVNLPVADYLRASKTFKHCAKVWRTGVDYEPRHEPDEKLPPYMLGVWLGDGTAKHPEFSTVDFEVVRYLQAYCQKHGLRLAKHQAESNTCPTYRICSIDGQVGSNTLLEIMRLYELFNNKHIPEHYLFSSRANRLELLAGILDTDGYLHHGYFEIAVKSDQLAQDVLMLARGLGFAAYDNYCQKTCTNTGAKGMYHRITISGHCEDIPTIVPRRKASQRRQIKSVLVTGFKVEPVGVGQYYGFTIEGPDRLFLLGDFTVTHNTKTAAYVMEKYASTGRQVLWLVHREELLLQAAMVFAENGIHHRMICAASSERAAKVAQFKEFGRSYISNMAHVVVCSVQTLIRRLDKLPWLNPSQIVADECHLSLNKTFRTVIGHYLGARLLGLTATPTRLDGQSFARTDGGLYDLLIEGPQTADLMDWGNLAPYEMYGPPIPLVQKKKIRIKGHDFNPQDLEDEFDSPIIYGDVIEHYRRYSHGKPAIGFCPTVKVAKKFAERFCEAGYRAVSLDGETDDVTRRQTLAKLATGEIDVVMSVSILVEGTDIPLATTALLLRKTKSLVIYLQSIGRVLRPHPDKDHAIILDFVGLRFIHGYPDDVRHWSLSGKTRRGRSRAVDGEDDVRIQTCPECFAVHKPAPACPKCGHIYTAKERKEIKEVAGNLERVTPEIRRAQAEAAERARRTRITEEAQCKTLEDFVQLGKDRGYQFAAAWARKRYAFRQKRQGAAA